MMKKVALLLSLCVLVLAMSTTAFAREINITQDAVDRTIITINGSGFDPAEQVGILALKPGVNSPSAINENDPIQSIDYIDQVQADGEGTFTLTYKSSGVEGVYKVYYTDIEGNPEEYEIGLVVAEGTISGKITSLGNKNEIAITVKKDGEEVKTANPDENGNFSIEGLAAGTYSVEFVKKGHLKLTINGVVVTVNETKALGEKALIPGDVNGDGDINIIDLQAVLDTYSTTASSGNYDEKADINDDTDINLLDLQNVLDNYGKTTSSYSQ